ncbi:hypothetical protein SprV_0100175100 [Sparganum proliferum]
MVIVEKLSQPQHLCEKLIDFDTFVVTYKNYITSETAALNLDLLCEYADQVNNFLRTQLQHMKHPDHRETLLQLCKIFSVLRQNELKFLNFDKWPKSAFQPCTKTACNICFSRCFEASFELEKGIGVLKEDYEYQYSDVLRQACSPTMAVRFSAILESMLADACGAVRLAHSPEAINFSGYSTDMSPQSASTQFVLLLQTRTFASSSHASYLTASCPVATAASDLTQATISTACTAWLSAIGSVVGLPALGFSISQSVQDLIHLIVNSILPTTLAFSLTAVPEQNRQTLQFSRKMATRELTDAASDAYQEVSASFIQALFRPLLDFLSSKSMDNSPSLTDQLANILADAGRPDSSECDGYLESDYVKRHIERMAAAIADFLALHATCDLLCVVWQTNPVPVTSVVTHFDSGLENMLFHMTSCAKQLEAAIRQLADRITDVAIEHYILVTLQPPRASISALMHRIETGTGESGWPEPLSPVARWRDSMDALWDIFNTFCPAGLARQMLAKVTSQCLLFLVQRFANTAWHDPEELDSLRREIWLTLETAYICLLRSSETTNDVMGCSLLSIDLQNLHSSGIMLVQCLVGLTAPPDVISALHTTNGFYANGVPEKFEESFDNCNWLKILDPHLFCRQSSHSDSELSMCRTRIALNTFTTGLHFDSITVLNLIFAQDAHLSRLLLAPPSWMAFCVPENCATFSNVASVYRAFYRIFATCPEHDDYYSALLLPLLNSLSSVECLDVHAQFPTLPTFPAWLSALLDFLGDFLDEICSRFQSFVLQRLAFDDSLSSERATELLSQCQGIDSLVENIPFPQTPAVWYTIFPEGQLPCGCSFSPTPALLEPPGTGTEPPASAEGDNRNGGSFTEAFKQTLLDCVVDLLSVPVQAFPEGLLPFFTKLDQLVHTEGSPLGGFRLLGGHALIHFLLLSFWWKIGSQASDGNQKKEAGIETDTHDPLRPHKLISLAVIVYMISSEVHPEINSARRNLILSSQHIGGPAGQVLISRMSNSFDDLVPATGPYVLFDTSPPNLDIFCFSVREDVQSKERGRRFILAQQLRFIQHSAFEDLLKVHTFLKVNASWLQAHFSAEDGKISDEAIGSGPTLSVSSVMDLRQRLQLPKCSDISELDWNAVCKLNVGLSPATLGHFLSLRGDDDIQPLLNIINKHSAAVKLT